MTLEGVFNHLVLPPKLPGGQDPHLDEEAQDFVGRLLAAVDTLDEATNEVYAESLSSLRQSLRLCGHLNRGSLDKDTLAASFKDFGSAPLILYVVEQNAALIIRQSSSDEPKCVIFEAFEASPSSEDVLASENALIQAFPGRACAVPGSCFRHEDFQSSLAEFLEKASMETLSRLTAHTRKAGVEITEARNTTDPAMITQLLMPLLESLGESFQASKFQKRVRDEVHIEVESRSGSALPFRRHPFWLVLRVAVERQLILSLGYHSGRALYKSLIAIMLAKLMEDVTGQLKPELTLILRSKLCRRLAKLEQERAERLGDNAVYERFFKSMGSKLQQSIQSVTERMEMVWANFRRQTMRHIEPLPAPQSIPPAHLRLQLRQSETYLEALLSQRAEHKFQRPSFSSLEINDEGIKHVQKFTERYAKIAELERLIRERCLPNQSMVDQSSSSMACVAIDYERQQSDEPSGRCVELAEFICQYFDTVNDAYMSNSTQMSALVLNVLYLWVLMDVEATEACPLLREFHPIFTPMLLDVLQLEDPKDFHRLSVIQHHLSHRIEICQDETRDIFSAENSSKCFQAKYVAGCIEMQSLYRDILEDSEEFREEKRLEWEEISNECEQLSQQIAALSCVCTGEPGYRTKDDIKNCTKCFLKRTRNRMNIQVHEDVLPNQESKAARIVFELAIPRWYEAYRNATFRIIRDLAWPTRTIQDEPPLILRDFSSLKDYQNPRSVVGGVTLASPTKSFLQTHWKVVQVLRGSLRDVLRPHAPEFDLYDVDHKVWMKSIDRKALTFQHICGVSMPSCLQEKVLTPDQHPPAVVDGPSSYAIISNQRLCPQQASVHEFSAYQRLLSGTSRRWMTILVELGSSHLNFSNAETVRLLSQLALQAGPTGRGVRREAYRVFADEMFCCRLSEMIDQRLDSIKSNWREVNLMELCITLSQRLFAFASSFEVREQARGSIHFARMTTLGWITRLRGELQIVADNSNAERLASYALRSALLCRRTFAMSSDVLTAEELEAYCVASIALQENMTGGFENDPTLKTMIISDTKMDIQASLYASLQTHPRSLETAVLKSWAASGDSIKTKTVFSSWTAAKWKGTWKMSHMTTTCLIRDQACPVNQVVHFNYVTGFLLVNGKPAGRLPERIRDSEEVRELFGDHAHLRTYPSVLGGMSHQLVGLVQGSQIHFGLRDDQVVVRAVSSWATLEFIPRKLFYRDTAYDLPVDLLENCVHFLNLATGSLQVHRRPKIWTLHWVINLSTRHCTHSNGKSGRLLCPYSETAQVVARLFDHFERPEFLKIFLSARNNLCVDLSRFELSFHVNKDKRLEETKLRREFDPNQDAGTFHGLLSKLVLRDVRDARKRTVIVPIGKIRYRLCGPHVEITVEPSKANAYAKYEIDHVLGRLTCHPEPTLIYHKALLHALTSFPIPDELTGKTGTAEAVHILQSGLAQPWCPISEYPMGILENIASLSPRRDFYPEDKRGLQKTKWDPCLSISIQHEYLETLARQILHKSHRLQPFFANTAEVKEVVETSHLRRRAEIRRSVYDPSSIHPPSCKTFARSFANGKDSKGQPQPCQRKLTDPILDQVYAGRDQCFDSTMAVNVKHIVNATFKRPFHLSRRIFLGSLLIGEQIIGGFQSNFAPPEGLGKLIEDTVISQFGELVEFSRLSGPDRLYSLAFRLALLSFKKQTDLELLEVLIAIARIDSLKILPPPQRPVFIDFDLTAPTVEILESLIRSAWPEIVKSHGKRKVDMDFRDQHLMKCEEEGRRLARWFVKQWPSKSPSVDGFQPQTKLIDETEALESILEVWQCKMHNLELAGYLDEIQQILDKFVAADDSQVQKSQPVPNHPNHRCRMSTVIPSLPFELLNKTIPPWDPTSSFELRSTQLVQTQAAPKAMAVRSSKELSELQLILSPFLTSPDEVRNQYGADLIKSLEAMRRDRGALITQNHALQLQWKSAPELDHQINVARLAIAEIYRFIIDALGQGDRRSVWLKMANMWPDGKITLLEQLRSKTKVHFGAGMKEALIKFGVMNTQLQWLERVRHYQLTKDGARLQETLKDAGHQNWDPSQRPDWLLMELECDLLIRPEQVEVANAIISPRSGSNSVLQMNMGQGKTSCIVPMSIMILAETTQIARLVVPKALLLQSAQVVQSRIGGLVGREIRHIPFSRRTPSTDEILCLYRDLHKSIREESGVILTTSDHMLSFKLSGLQRLIDSKTEEADAMIRFQETLTRFSRDVIDESDFTLGVKTQLIYPSGPQLSVDGAPHRWLIIQELLHLFEEHLPAIRKAFPLSVEVFPRSREKAFPMAFLLRKDAEDEFHRLVVDDIVNSRTSFLRLSESGVPPKNVQNAIRQFLSDASTKTQDKDGLKDVVNLFADRESAAKTILLVRGLILNKILLFCMKRRYNVQYGLHPARDPMAVPFEAKGVPSSSSEFGHPDVAIIFTTLSFYYGGLSPTQFRQSLSSVLKEDDAASAYDRWTHGCDTLPAGLRHWNVINCDDDGQVEELYCHLRLDRNVLNFYLNKWVFPLYAKQFGMKLSASAWDLPNFPKPQKTPLSGARCTGFSGTNDNKSLLPLTIRQDDLPGLVQTNAEVLSYLLQPRNRVYHLAACNGTRMSENQLLHKLVEERIWILIDAGAYILELSNEALVRKWLETNTHVNSAKAGVFFGTDNRAWVLYKGVKNKKVPLAVTPFADNLTGCLIFLDEAHCRGTDLRLPTRAKGALTLALGQTKDHTVQAAMRLRQLGTTQSVAFFAGPEVNQSIIDVCKLSSGRFIDSSHVVHWLLEQSCSANEQLANLHLAQGVDYCRRMNAQWRYDKFLTTDEHRMMLLNVIRQQERQTLNQQYGQLSDSSTKGSPEEMGFPSLKGFMSTLAVQRKAIALNLSAKGMHSSALEEVEQEREVEFQVEEVRQVQKRKVFKPLAFSRLHPAFENFVRKGRLVGDEGYVHAFSFMGSTSIGQKFLVRSTSSRFFVSNEFTRTVVLGKQHADNFLRPVEWILWSPLTETALVIIPEEVELLIPLIRRAGSLCMVHLISYAVPVTKSTLRNFNSLTYYNMPPLPDNYQFPQWFTVELGILSGRLYINHEECSLIAQYLRVSEPAEDQMDGSAEEQKCFARNPVGFMLEWLDLRRQSDIQQTPMGYILRGRIGALHPEHAFFTVRVTEGTGIMDAPLLNGQRAAAKEDEENDDDDFSDVDHDGGGIDDGWNDLGEELGADLGDGLGDGSGEDAGESLGRESPVDG